MVPAANGAGTKRRQIRAGARLREALTPHLIASQDAGEVGRLLPRAGFGDERRPGVQEPDEVDPDVGRAGPLGLFEKDQLLGGRRTPTAELRRPVAARVAGVEEHPLPRALVLTPRLPVVPWRLWPERGQHAMQPTSQFVPKRLLPRRIAP